MCFPVTNTSFSYAKEFSRTLDSGLLLLRNLSVGCECRRSINLSQLRDKNTTVIMFTLSVS